MTPQGALNRIAHPFQHAKQQREKDIPTQQLEAETKARLSGANGHSSRTQNDQCAPSEGPQAADGLALYRAQADSQATRTQVAIGHLRISETLPSEPAPGIRTGIAISPLSEELWTVTNLRLCEYNAGRPTWAHRWQAGGAPSAPAQQAEARCTRSFQNESRLFAGGGCRGATAGKCRWHGVAGIA